MRNKLVHKDFLTLNLLKKSIIAIINLSKKPNYSPPCVVDLILNQLYTVSTIIIGNLSENIGMCCPLCKNMYILNNESI